MAVSVFLLYCQIFTFGKFLPFVEFFLKGLAIKFVCVS